MRRLYIIGNGFDLKHNLPAKYSDFAKFCKSYDGELFEQINLLFPNITRDSLWSNFEEGLGEVELSKLRTNFYLNYKTDNTDDKFLNLHNSLQLAFSRWITRLKAQSFRLQKRHVFCQDDYFISFNYTDVLESLYLINNDHILHIHGYASSEENNTYTGYIFGHSKPELKINNHIDSFEYLSKDLINGLQKRYQVDLLKEQLQKWSIDRNTRDLDITALGHSLNKVDDLYFKTILEIVPNSIWHIGYYDYKDFTQKLKNVVRIFRTKQPIDFFRY